jgi:DNA-binding NarL/FixJ family response regulator
MYRKVMTNVFLADTQTEYRSVIRAMLEDLKMKVVGETDNWETMLTQIPITTPDLLLVDWSLINPQSGATLNQLRKICPKNAAIVLLSPMDATKQAAISAGVDAFISKTENAHHVEDLIKKVSLMLSSAFV